MSCVQSEKAAALEQELAASRIEVEEERARFCQERSILVEQHRSQLDSTAAVYSHAAAELEAAVTSLQDQISASTCEQDKLLTRYVYNTDMPNMQKRKQTDFWFRFTKLRTKKGLIGGNKFVCDSNGYVIDLKDSCLMSSVFYVDIQAQYQYSSPNI